MLLRLDIPIQQINFGPPNLIYFEGEARKNFPDPHIALEIEHGSVVGLSIFVNV